MPHDPAWAGQFAAEAARITVALGARVQRLHHIGSTAVPGLIAKPIIDMLAEARSLDDIDEATPVLEGLGYEAKGTHGIPGRRYFRRSDSLGRSSYHLHVYAVGDPRIGRYLAFRDLLRADPELAQRYGALTSRLAADGADADGIEATKGAFISDALNATLMPQAM